MQLRPPPQQPADHEAGRTLMSSPRKLVEHGPQVSEESRRRATEGNPSHSTWPQWVATAGEHVHVCAALVLL